VDKQRAKQLAVFLPRYRSQEEALAAHLGIGEIEASALLKGFQAMRAWWSETVVVEAKRVDTPAASRVVLQAS